MSRTILSIALGAGVAALAAGPAYALGSQDTITTRIPFSFKVGNTTLPAGTYKIQSADQTEPDVLDIRSVDRQHAVLVQAYAATTDKPVKSTRLVFDTVGKDHFLRAIWVPEETGQMLPTSHSELKDLIARAQHGTSAKRAG
jgi:hypothetical protein